MFKDTLSRFTGSQCRLVIHAATPQEHTCNGVLRSCGDGSYCVWFDDGRSCVNFLAQDVIDITKIKDTVVVETR